MDTEQRLYLENRLLKLERHNRYQWMVLIFTVAFCVMMTMTATGSRDGDFDDVFDRKGKGRELTPR